MWNIDVPGSDSQLLLTPRWGDLAAPWQWGLLALAGLVPLLLMVGLYRRELRALRRRAAASLLTLRLQVVALAWFLLALQPVLVQTTTEELPGYVLVAVDRSASMDFADPDVTRTEAARRILSEQELLSRLREKHHVHLIGFDKDSWDVGLDAVDALFRPAAAGTVTNLRAPLARALERSGRSRGGRSASSC